MLKKIDTVNKKTVSIFCFISILLNLNSEKITITAIGDIMAHLEIQEYAFDHGGYDKLFDHARKIFLEDDLTIANLETPISNNDISGYPKFNAKADLVNAIKKASIEVVNIANNHSLDQNTEGIISTIDSIKSEKLIYSGMGKNLNDTYHTAHFTKNNIKIGYIGITYFLNGLEYQEKKGSPYINYLPYYNQNRLNTFKNIVKNLKSSNDLVIISYHVGKEYKSYPSKEQKRIILELAKSGGDLILCHHPHVLQPTEILKINDREVFVAYSLGNFISAQARYLKYNNIDKMYNSTLTKTAESIILKLDIVKWRNKIKFTKVGCYPVFNISFKYKSNKILKNGFDTMLMEDILKLNNQEKYQHMDTIKKLVNFRKNEIEKLVNLPIFTYQRN